MSIDPIDSFKRGLFFQADAPKNLKANSTKRRAPDLQLRIPADQEQSNDDGQFPALRVRQYTGRDFNQ